MELRQKQDLVLALRKKGVAEADLPRLLGRAEEQSQQPGTTFSIGDFLGGVPAGTTSSSGTKLGRLAAGLLVLCIAVQLLLSTVLNVHLGFPGILVYYGTAALGLIILVFAAYYVDRRVPAE